MFSLRIRELDETIEYYTQFIGAVDSQIQELITFKDGLFDRWRGPQADICNERICRLIYGTEGEVSLRKTKERAEHILKALEMGKEVFYKQMGLCDSVGSFVSGAEEYYGANSYNLTYAGDKVLYLEDEELNHVVSQTTAMLEDELEISGTVGGSQKKKWRTIEERWSSGGIRYCSYDLSGNSYRIYKEMEESYRAMCDFRGALQDYKCQMNQIEEALVGQFGEQSSEWAKLLERDVYQGFNGVEVSEARLQYLAQKGVEGCTPEEQEEIARIFQWYYENQKEIKSPEERLKGLNTSALDIKEAMREELYYRIFRNYSATLQSKEMLGIPERQVLEKLSGYFELRTYQMLKSGPEGFNYDRLYELMSENPAGMTLGDMKAISKVFDELVAFDASFGNGVENYSAMKASRFLAQCYINQEFNGGYNLDGVRSPCFDKWAEFYLKENAIDLDMMNDLNSGVLSDSDYKLYLHKIFKMSLLDTLRRKEFVNMQIQREYSGDELISLLFKAENNDVEFIGDMVLKFYKGYRISGEEMEWQYYDYRNNNGLQTMLDGLIVKGYKDQVVDLEQYYRKGLFSLAVTAAKDFVGRPPAKGVTTAKQAFKLYIEGEKIKLQNMKIESDLDQYNWTKTQAALQAGGQMNVLDGEIWMNNRNIDEATQRELNNYYSSYVLGSKDITELFPDGKIPSVDSEGYLAGFVTWYHSGKGDPNDLPGFAIRGGNARDITDGNCNYDGKSYADKKNVFQKNVENIREDLRLEELRFESDISEEGGNE